MDMSNQSENKLPDGKIPYLLRSGEGERYLFGRQLATIIANGTSTDNLIEIVILSGGKGDDFPYHKHIRSHEAIYVLHGRLELDVSGQKYLLTEGNYAYIPAGTVHGYKMQSHRTQILSITSKGEVASLYSVIGEAYDKYVHPPKARNEISQEQFEEASLVADVAFVFDQQTEGSPQLVENGSIPEAVAPFVLETGEGTRLVAAEQLFTMLTTQKNTDGEFIAALTEGPKGNAIPEHYHEKHSETFFCLEGQLTMTANGEEIVLHPGDFLHVPAFTKHSYRLDSHYTKFIGFLATGLFEPFFHTLCDVYDDYIFPSDPPPFRFDRVLQKLHTLDLKPTGAPPVKQQPVEG
jgi:quercetin 2,3-dioxygenase